MAKIWSEQVVKNNLILNDTWVIRALIRLYKRQTPDERTTKETFQSNKLGFNKYDSVYLTTMAEKALANKPIINSEMREIRRRVIKYVKQLTQIANYEEGKKEGAIKTTGLQSSLNL